MEHADDAYLESLAGYDLDRLSKEPVRLSVEQRKIDAALEQLSFDNYRVRGQPAQWATR